MTSLVSPDQARDRARAFYERHCRDWAAELFMRDAALQGPGPLGAEGPAGSRDGLDAPGGPALADAPAPAARPGAEGPAGSPAPPSLAPADARLCLPLHPPTEGSVLKRPAEARAWARSWRESPAGDAVEWRERRWPSVGRQIVPERLRLSGAEELAAFAGRKGQWAVLRKRTLLLAERWKASWSRSCPGPLRAGFPLQLARAARSYEALDPADWEMLVAALAWLLEHPEERRYARELPIRGIDTKWIERHRKAVSALHAAFAGGADFGIVMKAPSQFRVRFLDDALAPCGLRDISASPAELNRYTQSPRAVVICENLVSTMTLPALSGVLALHGGGFGVGELGSVGWLSRTPVLYWGDLDSHGFAILNQWRHHHERTRSLMMDEETLSRHRDLCTSEAKPSTAELDRLDAGERNTLRLLLQGDAALRLEQERIEWGYAVRRLEEALKDIPPAPAERS